MLESFLFPWSMAAGGILISSPIIIHLINRMRFKRIRWAAMEFLLKSQKRNRRRLIIEQLILLLLRILLVLLAALIVARFIGYAFGAKPPQTTQHIILLDDTPSMGDQWQDNGETRTSFKEAKRLIVDEIARNAGKASRAQVLQLFRLSQPDQPIVKRLSEPAIKELSTALAPLDVSYVHVDLLKGVKKARAMFDQTPQDQRILYVVSDFRQSDWTGAAGENLMNELQEMAKIGIYVKFVDVTHPARKENDKDAIFHQNLAITNLQPDTRVAARNMVAQFSVTVANYGLTEQKNVQVKVKVNGAERAESSVPIPTVPPGGQAEAKFQVFLDQPGINQVSANLDPEDTGLLVDNTRYCVVEVRDKIPILVVDGDPVASRKEGGDAYFLQVLFNANRGVAPGYDVTLESPAYLEKATLEQYPTIYIVNVRELSDKAVQNLETFAKGGGGVGFFMGSQVKPEFYNKLHDEGKGLFPVPLADRPSAELTKEEKDQHQTQQREDPQLQIFLRNETHPIFAPIARYQTVFKYLSIDRHYPVPRTRWEQKPGGAEELATLPNRHPVDDYKDAVQVLLDQFPLEKDRPGYKQAEKYRPRLLVYQDAIRDIVTKGKPIYQLANTLDALLHDRGEEKNPELPNLLDFWSLPEMQALKSSCDRLRDTVQYGDPLVVAGKFGKGRTVVFLTSIGRKWSGWAGDFPASTTFPIIMYEIQKHLAASSSEDDLLVGAVKEIQLDATRYDSKMRRFFKPEAREKDGGQPAGEEGGLVDKGEQLGTVDKSRITFKFADAMQPGVYILEFYPRPDAGVDVKPEPRGFAFNIDTSAESNLLRADRSGIESAVPNSKFYTLTSEQWTDLQQKQSDLSEGPWLYLVFLALLVCEQALAVHLSFHVKGGATSLPAQVSRPQPSLA